MNYQQDFPGLALSPFIDRFWQIREPADSLISASETIIPDGQTELIFNWGDTFERKGKDGQYRAQGQAFLVGQINEGMKIRSTGTTEFFSIRFRSNGLYPFIRASMHAFSGYDVPVDELFPNCHQLVEGVLEAQSFAERVKIAESFLIGLQGRSFQQQVTLDHAIQTIDAHTGMLPIKSLADQVGCSQRQLERHFNRCVGLSAKQYARIVKFQHVFSGFETGEVPNWARLAVDRGYFDQAHFIHEFKRFTGKSPKQYFHSQQILTDLFWQMR